MNKVCNAEYTWGYKTDHSQFNIEIEMISDRGPGYWKLNNQLLHDKEYVDKANIIIDEHDTMHSLDPDMAWEICRDELMV